MAGQQETIHDSPVDATYDHFVRGFMDEFDGRLADARPKLKSYEAVMIGRNVRNAVKGMIEQGFVAESILTETARQAMEGLQYLKTSVYSKWEAQAHVH